MEKRLEELEKRYEELGAILSDPALASKRQRYEELAREYGKLSRLVEVYREYRRTVARIEEDQRLLNDEADPVLSTIARDEIRELDRRKDDLEDRLKDLLLEPDPADGRDVIVEIRAGTGGGEASLFVSDLFRMYRRFADKKGWRLEVLSTHPTEVGGFREAIFGLSATEDGIYSQLKYENGVHRVQRVPETESSGRIHTSAATVVVLPEADEVEVEIGEDDIRVDVFRSSGPGGQSVNTADSAVRITHIPTGLVVQCQEERSQLKNKRKAMTVLRARLLDMKKQKQEKEVGMLRRKIVGSGDRSEKIRTYNFPQNRVTDHRIHLTLYQLEEIMDGDIGTLIDALRRADLAEKAASISSGK